MVLCDNFTHGLWMRPQHAIDDYSSTVTGMCS
ncbi:Uncharacterised protein [Mycolicibacterium phlei]|jgi:hypothetical protein|nr:hypothetical protein MPHLCCUG_03313 [Mycolicibacterium phlei]STZ20016.1 Uncharacterised protein [Mycolicibacterium phlei]VEG10222.1 Uncharacterised protein [Mycobacteroides chelonae]